MKPVFLFLVLISIFLGFLPVAKADQIPDEMELVIVEKSQETDKSTDKSSSNDLILTEKPASELLKNDEGIYSRLYPWLIQPMRFTLKHEVFYKTASPDGIKDDRSSLRLEYSKFFHNNYFLQVDAKTTAFWGNDHRAEAENKDVLFETTLREAYLQASFGHTSVKAGVQLLIWGESNVQAITDVISPRDYSEAFFINLEDSRIGQPMLVVEQFTPIGDWQFFLTPFPEFNKYPKKGTAYFVDAYNGSSISQDKRNYKNDLEYGGRWKKTFGKSDICFMGASLIDNDYAYWKNGFSSDGKMLLAKLKERYSMAGMTFNYALGDLLLKGETALKMPKAFNDANFQVVKKDVVDSSLGLEYAPSGALTLSLEAGNSHILGWNNGIPGVPQNTNTLVLGISNKFLHDDLYVNWMTTYSWPYTSFLHILTTTYKWNDHVTLEAYAYYPDVKDKKSGYWPYRDQKQVAFKIQYQF